MPILFGSIQAPFEYLAYTRSTSSLGALHLNKTLPGQTRIAGSP
jgi:hypothetical protein